MTEQLDNGADNRVFLRGVLAVEPRVRALPSGDELCSFRLTVPRPKATYGRMKSDSIDCSTTRSAPQRSLAKCSPGDHIEVSGCLRRRFWRGANGAPASRYEVDVITVRRIRNPPKSKGAARGKPTTTE
jgi:single-strand DNA-binding protein